MAAPTAVGSVPAQTTIVGATVSLAASGYFNDPDAGNSLAFSATGFPSGTGLSISSSTGAITGTPTAADLASSFDVIVTATDEQNRIQTATVSFVVASVPSAAQNYYVNGTTGNDLAAGTDVAPWRTITRVNNVDDHASGHVDVWIAPGDYRNQPWIPVNGGADNTHRIRLRAWGTGVVNILGPSSGSILYGIQIAVPFVSILRESSSSYFRMDGEVVFGTSPGQVQKNGAPESVAHITRGMTVTAGGVVLDMNVRRCAGWYGLDVTTTSSDMCEFAINWEQHGTSYHSDGADYGDMYLVHQSVPVGS